MSALGAIQITDAEIEALLMKAAERLLAVDGHLLRCGASERAITHKLAEHLQRELRDCPELRDWHVDCEYNRDGHGAKRLRVPQFQPDRDGDFAVTVLPDIIIHQRGHNNENCSSLKRKSPKTHYRGTGTSQN